MLNYNLLHIKKRDEPAFLYENEDFSFELLGSYVLTKNSPNNTFSQNMHFHSYYELHMILDGCSRFEIENINSFDVKKGDFVIFSPKTKHKITKETSFLSKFVMIFKFSCKNNTNSQFYNSLEEKLKKCDVLPYNKHIHSIFQTIFQLSQKNNFTHKTSCLFLEISIIMELFNAIMEKKITSLNTECDDARINNAIEYIKSNLDTPLKVSDVARYIHLSTRQFTKIFTEQTGTPPGKYIKNQKIQCSIDLLINSDLSINDIANVLAFPDSSTFIKSFKKLQGNTPSKYKKTYKNYVY